MSSHIKYTTTLLLLCSILANAQTKKETSKQTATRLAAAINAHDTKAITALLAPDHTFIDPLSGTVKGSTQVANAWQNCFTEYPGYRMAVTQLFANGDTVAAFGTIGQAATLQIPASWKIVVHQGKVTLWQVYADARLQSLSKYAAAAAGPRVTGLGGIFFKSKDPKTLKAWYQQHLHLNIDQYGTNFEWREGADPSKYGATQWSAFKETTTYFAPSTKDYMINYRVAQLDQLINQFRKDSVSIVDTMETYSYGKFIHIMDPEGNKIELWEPVQEEYEKAIIGRTK